jgi:hypothetical protein
MIIGLLKILVNLKVIEINESEITNAIDLLKKNNLIYDLSVPIENNPAKKISVEIKDRFPVFLSSDFLDGSIYAVRNMIHETSKQFAVFFHIPELNHHLLEGLTFPSSLKNLATFIIIKSHLYYEKNRKRLELTESIVKKQNYNVFPVTLRGKTKFEQSLELLQLGSYVSLYSAVINKQNPSKIPWVDYFKKNINKI